MDTGVRMALLSRKGLLAIAAVIDVALHGKGRPVSAKALAARHALPARHLEPVLQALVRMGILRGIRGPRGGYELAREPVPELVSSMPHDLVDGRPLLHRMTMAQPVLTIHGGTVVTMNAHRDVLADAPVVVDGDGTIARVGGGRRA